MSEMGQAMVAGDVEYEPNKTPGEMVEAVRRWGFKL